MTPEDLARLHPRLYHVTEPDAWDGLQRHGLLPTDALLTLFDVSEAERLRLTTTRRPLPVALSHPDHGRAILNDNIPLTEGALATCLDDGLTPADWLRMLNARVFFWPDEDGVATLLGARFNRGKFKEVLAFDTARLVRAHAERVELCPINSGATIRKPARRGLSTFTPMLAMSFRNWRQMRGGRDRIREVVVRGGVPDIADYLVERRRVTC
jgi:hypothetical protein